MPHKLCEENGEWPWSDLCVGHPVIADTKQISLSFVLYDIRDCFRKSPNQGDEIIIKENYENLKKTEDYMT
jgi:hypothetical protein